MNLKTVYLLAKDTIQGIEDFFNEYDLFAMRLINLALAYLIAMILISIGWYIYELIVIGHLNQNGNDTITALKWSLLLMLPIADWFNRKVK
jgi:hypothetical protein